MKIEYTVNGSIFRNEITLHWFNEECLLEDHEIRTAIEDCASDYHENHDGWESTWPLTITLYVNGKNVGEEKVNREYDPVFECG